MGAYGLKRLIEIGIYTSVANFNFGLTLLEVILCMGCLLGCKIEFSKKAKRNIAVSWILFVVAADVATYLVIYRLNKIGISMDDLVFYEYVVDIFNIITIIALGLIFFLSVYKEKKVLRTIQSAVAALFLMLYEGEIVTYVYTYFMGMELDTASSSLSDPMSDGRGYIIIDIVCGVVFFCVLYFGFYKRKLFIKIDLKYVLYFVIWTIVLYIVPALPFTSYFDGIRHERAKGMVTAFLLLMLSIGVPIIIILGIMKRRVKEKNEKQECYLDAQLEYIRQYKNAQSETRAFRHDIVNNLSLLNMMLENDKTEEAKVYLKELIGNVSSLSPKYVTGDEVLDSIVLMKVATMKEKDIEYTSDGVIDGGMPMSSMDICNLFANAFDNAIEACESFPKGADKWIKMNIKRNDMFYIVKLSNSNIDDSNLDVEKLFEGERQFTSKYDKDSHGYGTQSMRKTVKKYGGMIKADKDKYSFNLTIMIPRETKIV